MPEESATERCPLCGTTTDVLRSIDPGRRLALAEAGQTGLPDKVCHACFERLSASVSQGLKLRMERDVRDKNKAAMWKNRVAMIKNARTLMGQRAYSDAAVQYEKYLRLLEVVHSLGKGELSPAVFNNSTRSKELTVVASVYWDLVRIYDTSPRYGGRMAQSTAKLAQFLPFSAIYPDIIRKAAQFARHAKNPEIMREFLRATQSTRGPCFVATAAFGPEARELHVFRRFRDRVLRPRPLGRQIIYVYYRASPPLARALRRHPLARRAARRALAHLARGLEKFGPTGGF